VLTVAKVTASRAGGYAGYLDARTQAPEAGDYYLRDGERVEAPGRWALGERGAAALGVDASAAVDREDFRAVMAVRHPRSGEPLRRVGANGEAVAAIDATFSAPKSVSAVWALSSPELRAQIEAAQERAVDGALAHAVARVPMVRRRVDKDTVLRERPAELLASSWRHTTARAVGGRPPDPQLHSHVVLHGAVREDGKVVAIESRAWLVHQRELGAAYRGELARELRGLGFGIERETGRGGRYFELRGVPAALTDEWSARHRQVREQIDGRLGERLGELRAEVQRGGPGAAPAAARLEALERSGQLMPAEQRAIAIATRSPKDELATAGDLDRAWWEAAREHGFDARSVEALRERGRAEPPERQLGARIAARLTEFDATFAPREARAVALEVAAGDSPERALTALERLGELREVLDLADGRQTTRTHRALERRAEAAAGQLAAARGAALGGELVDGEVERLGRELAAQGATLADEQEQAVRAACSDARLVVVVGQAGTGKSTALTGVARAHQAAGRDIVVTSTGAQAAERLAGELGERGVSADGYSTAALQAAVARGAVVLSPETTIIHDEAALASTREQRWLLGAAVDGGARVIAVGDPRQSQAVGAAGLWPAIEQTAREHGAHVELERIVRARDPADRRDQRLWRAGAHERALSGYAQRGRVVVEDRQQRAEDRALEAAHADRQAGKASLVVVQTTNDQLDALNARAQALRIQDGELGRDDVALRDRPYALRAGDHVVLRAASTHPELGTVRNGTRGEVLDVAAGHSATLRLADGREATWQREQLDAASVRLGYVAHSWPAQGVTVDRGHMIAAEHADANGSYVALTRARESTHIYASTERLDDVELDRDGDREQQTARLAETLGRSEQQVPSIATPLAHQHQQHAEPARESSEPKQERQDTEHNGEHAEAAKRPAEPERDRAGQAQQEPGLDRHAEADQDRERVEPERVDEHQVHVAPQAEAEVAREQHEAPAEPSHERVDASERPAEPERDRPGQAHEEPGLDRHADAEQDHEPQLAAEPSHERVDASERRAEPGHDGGDQAQQEPGLDRHAEAEQDRERREAPERRAEPGHDGGDQAQQEPGLVDRHAEAEHDHERVEPERVDEHQEDVARPAEAEVAREQHHEPQLEPSRERLESGRSAADERTRGPERDETPARWEHPDSDLADRREQGRSVDDASQPRLSRAAQAMQQDRSSPSVTLDQSMAKERDTEEQAPDVRAERGELVNDEPAGKEPEPEPESRAAQIMRERREQEREQEHER